jgi:hypothetical protein
VKLDDTNLPPRYNKAFNVSSSYNCMMQSSANLSKTASTFGKDLQMPVRPFNVPECDLEIAPKKKALI